MYTFSDLKYNKLYKRQIMIPFAPEDRRRGAAILLLTPNYNISCALMNNEFTIDRMKLFSSYYIEKDISHLINHEGYITTDYYDYDGTGQIPVDARSCFTEVSDIQYCSGSEAIALNEAAALSEHDTAEINEAFCRIGNKIIFFNKLMEEAYFDEAVAATPAMKGLDNKYKRLIYADRLRTMKDVVGLYDQVLRDNPWIKYTFPRLDRYKRRNLYVDLYYYIQSYLNNNTFTIIKSVDMFLTFMSRFLNDKRLLDAGYKRQIIYLPVYGWDMKPDTQVYDYKTNLNPISIIYKKLRLSQGDLSVFKGYDIIFFGRRAYFKFNIASLPTNFHIKFKRFINVLASGVDVTEDEEDESTNGIVADIVNDIETGTGAKINNITGVRQAAEIDKEDNSDDAKDIATDTTTASSRMPVKSKDAPAAQTTVNKPKISVQIPTATDIDAAPVANIDFTRMTRAEKMAAVAKQALEDTIAANDKEAAKTKLVQKIKKAASTARDKEDALDKLNADEEAKRLIAELEDESGMGNFKIDSTRANRINNVNDALLKKQLAGKNIRDLISSGNKPKELPESSLPIETINDEWHHMKAVNFEKEYDLDADIMKILYDLSDKKHAYPIAILDVNREDTSTTEDYVYTYTVHCENYKGERFTLCFDVPKFRNNRFMRLHGNEKVFSIEMPLLPISKTDNDTAQIATLYKKIFVMRNNTSTGRSNPYSDKLVKAINKYKGRNIHVAIGDNSRICEKYELPIDYIDLAGIYNKIRFKSPTINEHVTIYFNLDEITKIPGVSLKNGIPVAMTDSGKVVYYTTKASVPISLFIANLIDDPHFQELYANQPDLRRATYSLCKIMGIFVPVIVVLSHDIGLTKAMDLAGIKYRITTKRPAPDNMWDMIKLKDGFLSYQCTYNSMMLMNGLKECTMNSMSIADLNKKMTWIGQLDLFGGRQKSDGLDTFKEMMFDPITVEICKDYKLPTSYHEAMIYASNLLCDNKYAKVTNIATNRYRTTEIVAAHFYGVLSTYYAQYMQSAKHNHRATLSIRKDAIINSILQQNNTSNLSVFQPLLEIEKKNEISFKGYAGLNEERSYTLDKRAYDKSMENILCQSTNHAANVGINRQTTIDPNITGGRGYFKFSDVEHDGSITKSMGMTEALSPFMTTSDDGFRNDMSFTQTSKHSTPIEHGMPLLVTTGADQAMPYLSSDMFAFKAKAPGKITDITPEYMTVQYKDGRKDFIDLSEQTMKNSDGGFFVTLQLTTDRKVGSSFKEGDVLAWDKKSFSKKVGLQQLSYNMGCLAKIAIMTTEDGFEDSGVCSEWLSEAMASDIVNMKQVPLPANTNVLFMVKKGQAIREGEPILIFQNPFDDEDANMLLKQLSLEDDNVSTIGRSVVPSKTSGVISDIKIYRTCDMDQMSESLRKIVTDYEKDVNRIKSISNGAVSDVKLRATGKIEPSGSLKPYDNHVIIEIYMRYHDKLAIGETKRSIAA